jgi:uncharacterized protein (DUF169 family)
MLLTEAAIEADINLESFACIGNRVHTGMNNDELYYVIPDLRIAEVVAALEKIVAAISLWPSAARSPPAALRLRRKRTAPSVLP